MKKIIKNLLIKMEFEIMRFNRNYLEILIGMYIILLSLILAGCSQQDDKKTQNDRLIGVKIYDYQGNISELFDQWTNLGVNTVFSSVSLMKQEEFRMLAKKKKITTYIILPIFFDPDTLHVNPDLYAITDQGKRATEEWVEFVCPSRESYRKSKIEMIKRLIRELDPDGLSLDFIRHFAYWEKIYPDREPQSIANTCFDVHCLSKFQEDNHIIIPSALTNTSEIAKWITDNHLQQWINWKCSLITSMIADIKHEADKLKPGIKINVHAVPWRHNDFNNAIKMIAGQDFSQISNIADMLSPMTYAHMVKRDPVWIHAVVQDIASQTNCQIIPSIQVNKAYLNDPLTVHEFEESVKEALKPPSSGVIFWSWEQLTANPEKKQILRSLLNT
jgi:hypothetical protein